MREVLDNVLGEGLKSLSKYPLLIVFLIVFLTQSWIQVDKLDSINNTLMQIHEDSVMMQDYITKESDDTKVFVAEMKDLNSKIDILVYNK